MNSDKQSPIEPHNHSLHSASGFGKKSRAPFPEPGKQKRDDAMEALMRSLQALNDATGRSDG